MRKTLLHKNENGSVIVLALIMVVLLSLLGMAVSRTSSIDVKVASNETRALQDLYQAESGDNWALESKGTWMTDTFLTNLTGGSFGPQDVDTDGDGTNDTRIEIRCIEGSGTVNIGTLSTDANDVPVMSHIAPPPMGTPSSLKSYVIRRYAITSTSLNSNTQVQIGAFKLFNKS